MVSRFLRIARGSPAELSTQVELATTMQMLVTQPKFLALLEEVDRVLQFLIMSLERKRNPKK